MNCFCSITNNIPVLFIDANNVFPPTSRLAIGGKKNMITNN